MTKSGDNQARLAFPILIGDIGGTNARFAVVADAAAEPLVLPIVRTADFATIDEAIAATVHGAGLRPRSAVLAIAGPVEGDDIPLTNCHWVVRPKQMAAGLGLADIVVLNDFEAQALAVVALGEDRMEKIGGGAPEAGAARVVLGPGTGLGVAGLIHFDGRWLPVPGEGGHMDIGPRSPRDFEVFPHIEPLEGRISGEQILSGRGLVNVYRAVAAASGVPPRFESPADVTGAALAAMDPIAEEALALFVTCLGRTAGDLALVFMSKGGVFLTGGISQKIVPALKTGAFRAAFEDKAPHSALMRQMPVYVVVHPLAALSGLAAYAQTPERFGVSTRGRRWRD
jgi:glucokinase